MRWLVLAFCCGGLHFLLAGFHRRYERTQQIDPEFCDSNYWMAITHANLGNIDSAWHYAVLGLDCPFNLVQSNQLLQSLYKTVVEPSPVVYVQCAAFACVT